MKHINPRSQFILINPANKKLLRHTLLIAVLIIIFVQLCNKEAYAYRKLFMQRPKLGLDFTFEYEKDERSTDSSGINENITQTFTESFDIETGGWVYHPALLTYSLILSPEWKQTEQSIDMGEEKRTTSPFLEGYFASFTFLQYKPYTLILTGNRNSTTTRSSFAERSIAETDIYSAKLQLKYPILPSSLNYIHTAGKRSGFFKSENRSDQLILNMRHEKYLGTTVFDASFSDAADTMKHKTIDTQDFKTGLNNYYSFTKDKNVVLNSNLSYQDKENTNTLFRRKSIYENLNWVHMENLTTHYTLHYDEGNIFDKLNNTNMETDSKAFGFNLTHLLYENLRTSFDADAKQNNTMGGRANIYGPKINFNYNRNIPWGILNLNTGFDYKIFDNKPRASSVSIIESITLTENETTYLSQKNVLAVSRVEDAETLFQYIEGVHYTIIKSGNSTGIRPTTASIIIGRPLDVTYEYSFPSYDYSTFSQSYGVSFSLWKVWNISYQLSLSKQKFIAGIHPESLTNDNIHHVSTDLEWRWNRASLEWEDQYTDTAPTLKWHLNDIVTLKPNEKTYLSFSANYGETRFKDTMALDKAYGFRSGLQLLIKDNSYLDASLFINHTKGPTIRNTTRGLTAKYELSYLIYTLNLNYEFRNEEDKIAKQTLNNNYFSFNIKRTLF